jgi:peptidyl-prolyl cis-trans isomerase C
MKTFQFKKYTAPVLLLGLLFFSCSKNDTGKPAGDSSHMSPDVRVVATVNGDPITLAEFLERFSRAGFKLDNGVESAVRVDFLNRLIERKMLLREAQRKRIKVSLPEINKKIDAFRSEQGKDVKETLAGLGVDYEKWKADIWENLMIEKLLAREIDRHVSVPAAEVRKYYQSNLAEFEKPEQARARQIVVPTEAEAQKVLELLRNQPDFAKVAREKSTAPEAANGGDLGYFAKGEMPAEFNVVFDLSRGGTSGVVKSPYGYHIFRLEDKRPAGRRGIEEVWKDIEGRLRREKQEKKFKQWMKEVRSRTKFEVNYRALE